MPPRGVSSLVTRHAYTHIGGGTLTSNSPDGGGAAPTQALKVAVLTLRIMGAIRLARVSQCGRSPMFPRPASEPIRVGPYTLTELIGQGGMAVVYRAKREGL